MLTEICLFDLRTRETTVVLQTKQHLEAPNWTPDNRALLVNGAGRLYRLDLATSTLSQLETGFANRINNDHGPSPDGSMLAITDKTETGKSCIYVLPMEGGTPRRVTDHVPSYFHGWSPDGTWLTYPGFRGAAAEIFICPSLGGTEQQLTTGFDHCDGPDFTPDGEWIWFNGERDGAVDLWRIRPDGTDLQQMTEDARVNWFPHPCPKGTHVLYLAYPPGTKGHPANCDVELRLLSSSGGPSTHLLDLFGGQGSLNVPCWAPDGHRFAFARYKL